MMERTSSSHDFVDDDDRRSRFQNTTGAENGSASLRERAASQPPRSSSQAENIPSSFVSSPPSHNFLPSSLGGTTWSSSTTSSARLLGASSGRGQPVPIRSSSFSAHQQGQFSSVMRDRAFPSTFEDDEDGEALEDTYEERYMLAAYKGRGYNDPTRSRSQSLATGRAGPVGSPYLGTSAMQSWNESYLNSNPLNIPGGGGSGTQRYGEYKPPGSSRYGSLGTIGRSPTNIHSPSSLAGAGFSSRQQQADITNMSPFVRDVGQILLDDGSAFRELWAGMNPPRDENGGGGSGTTSRRHSVSVVQPRRGNIVGFHPANESTVADDQPVMSRSTFQSAFGPGRGGSGLLLSDDDLAVDLGLLNLNPSDKSLSSSSSIHPPSQPASLPIYAPLSRSPPSRDLTSAYQGINLSIPTGSSYQSRAPIATPSDGGFSGGGSSPPRSSGGPAVGLYEQHLVESQMGSNRNQQSDLTARYIPGQGIQYIPSQQLQQQQQQQPPSPYIRQRAPSYSSTGGMQSPVSPTSTRGINPQQGPFYPQTQRRLSDAHHNQPATPTSAHQQQPPSLSDLGKGLPLHAVPNNWPLYIVEFKAGRTDLFYATDPQLAVDLRVGDLVVVEADRGKDLGKIVNDRITISEVEAFQRDRDNAAGHGSGLDANGQPVSPGGGPSGGSSKKEINPKMIYGKANQQDVHLLATKTQDELKALQLCQTKVRAKKLPMEVIDAEYQWDRRKLTFYFIAEKRIDFRELVRELFRYRRHLSFTTLWHRFH
ncbi:PSP1 C-terminal conserved region-domain-containing protein [Panaeolus papilionaceus]|nr:PSP1 C-terminal conserved region-domain-containing protein [Panaeolus papilionaceus]